MCKMHIWDMNYGFIIKISTNHENIAIPNMPTSFQTQNLEIHYICASIFVIIIITYHTQDRINLAHKQGHA